LAALAVAAVAAVASVASAPATAADGGWRVAFSFYEFRWDTDGARGRPADCRSRACDDEDFRRANLDNAMGVRLGAEKPVRRFGGFDVLAGGEVGVLKSEYNRSQRDVHLGEALATVGVASTGSVLRVVARAGLGGAFTDDGRGGVAGFVEAGVETPIGPAAGLRLCVRRARRAGPESSEAALSLVARPAETPAESKWELSWTAGASLPGAGPGGSLGLGRSGLWQLGVHRRLGPGRSRLGALVAAVDRESRSRSRRLGVEGNQRGLVTFELAGLVDGRLWCGSRSALWLGGGLRLSQLADDDRLLVDGDGERVEGGLEVAPFLALEGRLRATDSMDLAVAVEQLYWARIALGETRVRFGVAVRP